MNGRFFSRIHVGKFNIGEALVILGKLAVASATRESRKFKGFWILAFAVMTDSDSQLRKRTLIPGHEPKARKGGEVQYFK
jgi:hypothetical protein